MRVLSHFTCFVRSYWHSLICHQCFQMVRYLYLAPLACCHSVLSLTGFQGSSFEVISSCLVRHITAAFQQPLPMSWMQCCGGGPPALSFQAQLLLPLFLLSCTLGHNLPVSMSYELGKLHILLLDHTRLPSVTHLHSFLYHLPFDIIEIIVL